MSLKIMQDVFLWKRFYDASIESYVGVANEPILDMRSGINKIRLCDGVTPSGVLVVGYGSVVDPVGVASVNTPTITSPANNAVDIVLTPIISSSQFSGKKADGSADTHVSSQWQISTVATFATILHDTGFDVARLTSHDTSTANVGALTVGTVYYVRVKYKSASGVESDWSSVVSFTTNNFTGLKHIQDLYINGGTAGPYSNVMAPIILFLDNNTLLFGVMQNNDPSINGGQAFAALCKTTNNIWSIDQYISSPSSISSMAHHMAFAKHSGRVVLADDGYINFYSYENGGLTFINNILKPVGFDRSYGSIDISDDGNVLIVGAANADGGLGKIHIYRWSNNTYVLDVSYRPATITSVSRYGEAVAISGDGTKAIVRPIGPHTSRPTQYKKLDLLNIAPGSVTLSKDLTSLYSQQELVIDNLLLNPGPDILNYDGSTLHVRNGGVIDRIVNVPGVLSKSYSVTPYSGSVPNTTVMSDDGTLMFTCGLNGSTLNGKGTVMLMGETAGAMIGETEYLNYQTHAWGMYLGANGAGNTMAMSIKDPSGLPAGHYLRMYELVR